MRNLWVWLIWCRDSPLFFVKIMGSPEPQGTAKKFTYKELTALNKPENAHVAYNGKVSLQPRLAFSQSNLLFPLLGV